MLRNKEGKRTKLFIPFTPYLYVRERDYKLFNSLITDDIKDSILKVESGFRGIDGSKLLKITVEDPSNISDINKQCNDLQLFESNVLFHYRYLIDNNLITGIDQDTLEPVDVESIHKIAFIDIEVLKDSEPDPKRDPVIVIGLFDYSVKKYYLLYIGEPFKVNIDNIILTACKDVKVIPCKSEAELFSKFADVWHIIQPDIISSFTTFDMKYLVNRMNKLRIDCRFLSPIYSVNDKAQELKINCLHIVDYAELYRKVIGEPVWSTLEHVSQTELKYGKLTPKDGIVKTWMSNYKEVVEYNLRDVELLNDLEDKIGIIKNYLMTIWKLTGLDLADCLIENRIGDMLYFRYLGGKVIFYSQSPNPKIPYAGGLVGTDKTGLFHNIAVFDWNELYPTIMETFHISLDTFDTIEGDIKIDDKVAYTSSKPGWANEMMKPLRKARQEQKQLAKKATDKTQKRMYKIMAQAFKTVTNGIYGLFGQKTDTFTSRFYDGLIAGSIPYMGRVISEKAREIVESYGYTMVYRDTDSLFIQLKNVGDKEEIVFIKKIVEDGLSKFIQEKYGVKSLLRLDLEYVIDRIFIPIKKKYIGYTVDGEKVVKGMRIIQKNTSKFTVTEETKVADMRLNSVPVPEIKKYVDTLYRGVQLKKYPIKEIAVKGKNTKKKYTTDNRNTKAVKYAKQKLGINIKNGERFYWLYVIPNAINPDMITCKVSRNSMIVKEDVPANVIAFISVEEFEEYLRTHPNELIIDYTAMADFNVKQALEKYIEEPEKTSQVSLTDNKVVTIIKKKKVEKIKSTEETLNNQSSLSSYW